MVDRHDVIGASGVGHGDGFFGIAMIPNPGTICANGHNRGGERTFRAQIGEERCVRGVAGEEDAFVFALEDVAVVTAFKLVWPALAPMLYLDGFNREIAASISKREFLVPAKLANVSQTGTGEQVTREFGSDGGSISRKPAKRRQVHVVQVRVREQHDVNRRKFL